MVNSAKNPEYGRSLPPNMKGFEVPRFFVLIDWTRRSAVADERTPTVLIDAEFRPIDQQRGELSVRCGSRAELDALVGRLCEPRWSLVLGRRGERFTVTALRSVVAGPWFPQRVVLGIDYLA